MTDEREEETQQTDLALVPVQSLFTPAEAANAWRLFLEWKKVMLGDSDYATIRGMKVIRKSGLRKMAVSFDLRDRIVEQERADREDGTFTWRMVVEVRAPNGRICTGVAVCDSKERKFAHVEHDVYATCHTRAKNRAISDMVAGGVVSAEEMAPATGQEEATTVDLDVKGIVDALESAGLDTEEIDISIDLEGTATVKPRKFLGDAWDQYNQAMWKVGLSWVKPEGVWKGRGGQEQELP